MSEEIFKIVRRAAVFVLAHVDLSENQLRMREMRRVNLPGPLQILLAQF